MYNNNFGFNPYYQPQRFQQVPQQPMEQMVPTTSISNRSPLNGKSVDSIDVVKAMDIPLDGSISYFPLTDGSAIVTKQLQSDGTSKTTIYKPIEEKKTAKYITQDEIDELQKELKDLKSELRDLKDKLNSEGDKNE